MLSDMNNDRAVDLIVIGRGADDLSKTSEKEPSSRWPSIGTTLPATRGVAVLDFNKDGWMDVAVTHDGAPGVTLWRNVEGKSFERVPLPLKDVWRPGGLRRWISTTMGGSIWR